MAYTKQPTTFTSGTVYTSAWGNWVNQKTNEFLSVTDFGGDPTGTTDSTSAINAAITAAASDRKFVIINGVFKYSSQITVPAFVWLIGFGALTESASSSLRGPSCLLKDFNGQGVVFSGDNSGTDGVQYDSTSGKTGDNVQVIGSRWHAPSIASTNAGQDGVRLGADSGSNNTNLWYIGRIITRSNGRHGLHVNDPVGGTDVGGGTCDYADMIGNGGDGIKHDNGTWNTFKSVVCQNNTGYGMRITANSRSVLVIGGDLEGNIAGNGILESGTLANIVIGPFYGSPACFIDSSGNPGKNLVLFYDPDIGYLNYGSWLNVVNKAAGGSANINLFADTGNDNVSVIKGTKVGTTGGKLTIQTKVDGNVPVDRVTIDQLGITSFLFGRADKLVVAPIVSLAVSIDASLGNRYQTNVTATTAFTINTPTNPTAGQLITHCIRNTSGGALLGITWPANYKMSAWTNPATGFSRSISLRYDGAFWIEESRTPNDVPN